MGTARARVEQEAEGVGRKDGRERRNKKGGIGIGERRENIEGRREGRSEKEKTCI